MALTEQLVDPNHVHKRCVECDRRAAWSNWFCPACGGRLVLDKPQTTEPLKGTNRKMVIINDRREPVEVILGDELVRAQPGSVITFAIGADLVTLLRFREDGSVFIGGKKYAEDSKDVQTINDAYAAGR